MVHSMDRLARNLRDLLALVKELTQKGVTVKFVKEHLAFSGKKDDSMATLMLQIMGACVEFERAMLRERTREGIALAIAEGRYKGRKPKLTPKTIADLSARVAAKTDSVTDLAEEFGVSRQTIYMALKREAKAPA